ncbi:STK36 [Symbiodinium microadriaticum]|nr:STK36 [Symbiodinium microadriaticum]
MSMKSDSPRWLRCEPPFVDELDDDNELGSRDALLQALGVCARLCYGAGFVDREDWGKADPPLDGEGWQVVEQIVESMNSDNHVQAACYIPETKQTCGCGMGIVAIRGTVSFRGLLQDLAVGTPFMRRAIRHAIKEACSFYLKCKAKHPTLELYITGHSLGGFIAQAAATYVDAEGAVFNCPGPVAVTPWKVLVGPHRPNFEVHLTRDDPLAFSFFPKPENFHHIAWPQWHPGSNHRVCEPYMKEVRIMRGVKPNRLPLDNRTAVDQMKSLEDMELEFPLPEDVMENLLDTDSESDSDDSQLGSCYLWRRGCKAAVCG